MAKVTWKGALKLAFLTIPVGAIATAESSEKISFNQLHQGCNARINQKKVCSKCGKEVSAGELLKGYEFTKGQYAVFTEEEVKAVKVPSERTVNLTSFPTDTIDPLVIDKTYYLVPDGPVALDSYSVMQKALEGRTAIGRISMNGSEKQVAVVSRGPGIMMHLLHEYREVRDISALEQLQNLRPAKPDEVALAIAIMEKLDEPVDLADFEDSHKAALRRMIDARIKGEDFVQEATEDEPAPAATSLADMLKTSLAAIESIKPKKQAKADLKEVPKPVAMAAKTRKKKTA